MRKLFICILIRLLYVYCIFGCDSLATSDIKLKFSAFLRYVEVTKCAKIQGPRCEGFRVGNFWISPIRLPQNSYN